MNANILIYSALKLKKTVYKLGSDVTLWSAKLGQSLLHWEQRRRFMLLFTFAF